MGELLTAFALGNSAILTNACMLPLYPGLIAFMVNNRDGDGRLRSSALLGILVLCGILTMMLLIALALFLLRAPFGSILPVLLPVVYLTVIILGVLLVIGRSPFARLNTIRVPALRNPNARAFLYGFLLAPMTLPCTGPIVTSVFVLGTRNSTELINGLLYFSAFGLGFGWPLVLLPLLARAGQRSFVGWLTQNHRTLEIISGLILIGIGLYGIVVEWIGNGR